MDELLPLLYAPESYITASPEVRSVVVNGCGPAGWKAALIPDSIWGLDITTCCNIHDWMYATGSTILDKDEADRVFLNNMLRLIEFGSNCWLLKRLRRNRASVYYQAVHFFGGPAFWEGKNLPSQLIMENL